jgi:molecular chaperone HscA
MFTVGIDLGTTASVVAFVQSGRPRAIVADSGKKTVPSVVNYGENFPIVGREAIFKVDLDNTVFSVKRFMGDNKKFCGRSAEEVSADILSFMKKSAEEQLRFPVDAAVISVPAHFSESQRIATKRAASIAGIKVLRLISEPAAAAIAFGLNRSASGIYAVYDFGGGTFDFSILRQSNGIFQVLATGGDNYLGGDDVDIAVVKYNFERLGLDFSEPTPGERMLGKLIAKSMKESLGNGDIVRKNFVYRNEKYDFCISEEKMREIINEYMNRTFAIVDQVFRDAGIGYAQTDGVVLVGGMTKMPMIKEAIRNRFNINIFDEINPEEAVALGAAIHADSIASRSSGMLLIDVVPLTLGVETLGGGVDKIIHRNTPIPVAQTREYTTYENNQTGIKFHIVQGERTLAKDCRSIANFELSGIPLMPSGIPRVIVQFSVDVNGLLSVNAYEKSSGISQSVTVEPSSGLSDDEMISILENAAKNKAKDDVDASYIAVKVECERLIKFWRTIIDDIPEKEREIMSELIDSLKQSLEMEKYQDALKYKKNIEEIVGKFLDSVISDKLSKRSINIKSF